MPAYPLTPITAVETGCRAQGSDLRPPVPAFAAAIEFFFNKDIFFAKPIGLTLSRSDSFYAAKF